MTEPLLLIVMFLLVGYLLLALELLVIPGFGIAGIGGFLCLGIGSFLAFRYFETGPGVLVIAGVIVLSIILAVGIPRTRYGRAIVHRDTLAGIAAGRNDLAVGAEGVAESDLRPSGIARFGGRRESVVTEGEYITVGTTIRVTLVEGGRVVVESANQGAVGRAEPEPSTGLPKAGDPREGGS